MASIIKEANGRKTIQFVDPVNKRRRPKVRLGKATLREAHFVKNKIERLISVRITGDTVDADTSQWVADIPSDLASRLAALRLIESRGSVVVYTLEPFLDAYIKSRAIRKENTRRNYNVTRGHLISFFGEDRRIDEITAGDADEWRHWLAQPTDLRKKLEETTIGREVKRARQFFRGAVRKKLINENPFADVDAPAQVNTSREYFVTIDDINLVIDECPDREWRLIVALARFGGLRIPSEIQPLRLGDIDWEHERFTVHPPKTEHHAGHETRVVPIFAELRPYLEEVFDHAEPGTEYLITQHRGDNLRTQFERIIKRAGLTPWPKLFQNLRASRETELTSKFPLHVVCAWIGNSERIAAKHYLQVTDDHFSSAVQGGAESGAQIVETVQNPVQQRVASCRTVSQEMQKTPANAEVFPIGAISCETSQFGPVPPRGVEPLLPD